ncbi:MAG: hypothetical protein R3211_07665 [Balneolaceae bacterium]|nr:hypothetical protein [Balneolaceae bacterium]
MSSDSRKDREKLKEEYKEHYRKIREIKERGKRARTTQNITNALKNMDSSQLMENFDEFLYKVKSKLANVEARLDVAMDDLMASDEEFEEKVEQKEELQKAKAKETLKQLKLEMGLLYNEIERHADAMQVEKTIGTKSEEQPQQNEEHASAEEPNKDKNR